MTRSMTGFARHELNCSWGVIIYELRSVNHRYLEPHFRLPENLRSLEPGLREQLRKNLSRGKLEIQIQWQVNPTQESLALNTALLGELTNAAKEVAHYLDNPAALNPLDVLRWPGVIAEKNIDQEQVEQDALKGFKATLDKLIEQRTREGAELQNLIEQRLDAIGQLVAQVREKIPVILANQKQKILDKIAALELEVDQSRLEQELVYLAQKSDVDEELDRLTTHVTEVRHCFKQNNPIGRRLDFLMQELNREANTLSSKSTVSDTTQVAVELKVLIEQMREQVQNIE